MGGCDTLPTSVPVGTSFECRRWLSPASQRALALDLLAWIKSRCSFAEEQYNLHMIQGEDSACPCDAELQTRTHILRAAAHDMKKAPPLCITTRATFPRISKGLKAVAKFVAQTGQRIYRRTQGRRMLGRTAAIDNAFCVYTPYEFLAT